MRASAADIVGEDVQDICERVGESLKRLEGATLLVAGGGGFLASYLLDAVIYANNNLLDEPCRLIALDNFVTGHPQRLAHLLGRPDFTFIRCDLTQPLDLNEPIDFVIHAASIASPKVYRKYPLETVEVNVAGTRNLLELARRAKVKSLLYLSSSEVYGDPPDDAIPTPETYRGNVSTIGPRACYDESKRLAESLGWIYWHQFDVPVKTVRPFNVYGPRLRLDDGRVIPDFLGDALKGRSITLYSDGKSTRSFCYVADAAVALLLLLLSSHDGEAFNVGHDEEVAIESVAEMVNEIFGGEPGIRFAKSSDVHYLTHSPRRRCPDLTRVKRAIPWEPVVNLREGLRRTADSYSHEAGQR
jgi:nucleoside-diphosphate-sugar epimerase